MSAFNKLALSAALALLTMPAWAELTYVGTGTYDLGSGSTVANNSSCGLVSGRDALDFRGSSQGNVGIHAYACDGNVTNFGSRASGDGTYSAQGIASITGSLTFGEDGLFSFFINPGEVGAFGSTALTASEYQKASLTIKLVIDGVTYMDEAWSAVVTAGGDTSASSYTSLGSYSVGTNVNSGDGYYSFGLSGGYYDIALTEGTHDISYVMTSTASGFVDSTSVCTGFLQGGNFGEVGTFVAEEGGGAPTGQAFTAYCGSGARSGDPFNDPIARVLVQDVPEPMTASLVLAGLLAAGGVRRRNSKR